MRRKCDLDSVNASALLKLAPLSATKALIVLSEGQDTGSMHNLRTRASIRARTGYYRTTAEK